MGLIANSGSNVMFKKVPAGVHIARCVQVSPATHPPCNAANPCSLIKDEIERARVLFAFE